MTIGNVILTISELILFLVASYFLFYNSWLKAMGREVAKLSTIEALTKLKEDIKIDFSEKLEAYKSKLSEELSLKIEPLKSELARNNITHQIQFAYLHQERATVILELYKKLQELHSAMISWTAFIQPVIVDAESESQERTKRVNLATTDFKNYYITNKLFFSKSFCGFIDEVFKEYWDKGWEFGYDQGRINSGNLDNEQFQHYSSEMVRISKEIREKLPPKIQEIEDKFRAILNVKE